MCGPQANPIYIENNEYIDLIYRVVEMTVIFPSPAEVNDEGNWNHKYVYRIER